jgi:hypothetical protein
MVSVVSGTNAANPLGGVHGSYLDGHEDHLPSRGMFEANAFEVDTRAWFPCISAWQPMAGNPW